MYFGKNLLFASTLAFTSLSVSAEIVDGVRQQPLYPQVTKTSLQFDKSLLLFNKASGFFCGANEWKTRASVSEQGYRVFVSKYLDSSGAWDGKTVIIKDSVERNNSGALVNTILMVWAAPDGVSWVDWKNQADTLWTITQVGDNYRISVSSQNPSCNTPDTYLGTQKGVASETRLFWNLPLDKANADWYFVDPSVFASEKADFQAALPAYKEAVEIYSIAQSLKALVDEAAANQINVDAQKAVYLNEQATKEELEAAIQEVKNAMAAAEEGKVSADAPVDKTSLIVNPSYEKNSNDGWSGDKPGFQSYANAEFYQKKFNTYQNIVNAPRGVYALSVQAFYRSGTSTEAYRNFKNMVGYDAKLYAVNGTDTVVASIVNPFSEALTEPKGMNESSVEDEGVTYYIPNNMQTAGAYFDDGRYKNMVFFATDDGTMTVGMYKNNGDKPAGNWALFDNWGLKYYGNGADAYTLWLTEVKKSAKDFSSLPENVLVTDGMVDAYNSIISGITTASDKADVLAAISTINAEQEKVEANIAAWKGYQEVLVRGKKIANDESIVGQDKSDLADYLDLESEDIISALALTTEEIVAETNKVAEMVDAAIKNGITPGTDVTDKYLVNADFEVKDKGWTVKKANGGNVAYGGNASNQCFEAWNNADFDVYQEINGAPVGVYEISVQGFYRYMRGTNAYNAYIEGNSPNDVVNIYVNNRNAHFKSVFDEKVANGELYDKATDLFVDPDEAYWYPNDMASGSVAFANGMYKATSFGVVAKAGDVLRIGVKGATNQQGDSWAIWDDFKMVFRGTDSEVVKPLLSDVIGDLQETIAAGKATGKSVVENADNVVVSASEALNGTDGKAMFQSLCDVLAANEAMGVSAALFASLNAKAEELNSAYLASEALEATKSEAASLFVEVSDGISSGIFEDEDVPALIEKMDALIIKLAIPAEAADASDSNPVDLTSLIKTPGFDDGLGANSIAGWEGTEGYSFGNDATQKAALAVEFYAKAFDINQTIKGLPNGTYKVAVTAFYRFGSTADDYAAYTADSEAGGNAFLYTVAAGDSIKVPVCLLASGATDDLGIAGTANIAETELYVPNDMVSATAYFADLNAYKNEIIVKVTDGNLKIGMLKNMKLDNDWVIMDNWTLTYYGENSVKEPTVDIDGISEDVEPATVEIFNMNGIKMDKLAKGVNIIRMTSADGKVTVKKVNLR